MTGPIRVEGFYMGTDDAANAFQQELHAAARAAAAALPDVTYAGHFAANDAATQVGQVLRSVRGPDAERPHVLMIMPANDDALTRSLRDALKRGIVCCLLQRTTEAFAQLREEPHTGVLAGFCTDQASVGALQAEQCRKLLPAGGSVLLARGPRHTWSATARAEAFKKGLAVPGTKHFQVVGELDGDWTGALAAQLLERRLGQWPDMPVDAVACGNDEIAAGIVGVLPTLATRHRRPGLLGLPVLGVDALQEFGRRLVDRGQLAASVVQPLSTVPAIDRAVRYLRMGKPILADTLMPAESYPPLERLRASASPS
jgi:ABC-type sugar transport system substrate-binding protein